MSYRSFRALIKRMVCPTARTTHSTPSTASRTPRHVALDSLCSRSCSSLQQPSRIRASQQDARERTLSYRGSIHHANRPIDLQGKLCLLIHWTNPQRDQIHSLLLWWLAAFEVIYALNHYLGAMLFPWLSAHVDNTLCPASRSHILTPLFLTGVLLTVVGMFIRVRCFQELGQLFTFDLSILPDHRLVTSGSYSHVRHPAYTGSILIVIGIALSHLTAGSLLVECSALGSMGSALLWGAWWTWTLSVGISRAMAEDKELQKMFGSEWDAYAATTKFWFFPGLC